MSASEKIKAKGAALQGPPPEGEGQERFQTLTTSDRSALRTAAAEPIADAGAHGRQGARVGRLNGAGDRHQYGDRFGWGTLGQAGGDCRPHILANASGDVDDTTVGVHDTAHFHVPPSSRSLLATNTGRLVVRGGANRHGVVNAGGC
ncbi:hypothetical protein ACFV9E_07405 [Streptomyces sp. NPDC059835]|uniref:hypothetical protein n=1 Tax=Streptomyces sp. NPDC059835 TaxID=3346967 RepID=UPI0036690824